MPSIIEGYSYDIFISYRQNDNKYDGWVTEFVDNLNKELEANIKDKISVYFDINPQDGLLETDSVDKSLEDKLKCLVFIPIISRTYCDSKSFAWQNEFCAFNKLAKEDQFGRDIRLTSGNVTSRILPVQIHDLDAEDKKLVENELGGFIRGIEFIYKEPGVNRPLRSDEDHPDNNLNKTFYRNQINKVANAVKEIITALKKLSQHPEEVLKEDVNIKLPAQKNHKTTIIAGSIIVLALIVLGIFLIPKLLKPSEQLEKSIAVLPFRNDTPVDSNKYFINGIMEEILNDLQTIKDLRVLGRTSVEQYRDNNTKSIQEIARELGVNYIVEGSGQKYGNTFRLRVQLIRAKGKETHLWAKSYEKEIRETKDIFTIQNQIAQSISSELEATITPEEKSLIEKTPTKSLSAYDFYQLGREEYGKYVAVRIRAGQGLEEFKKAELYYLKALEYDSTFAQAYIGLAGVIQNKYSPEDYLKENWLDSVILFCNKALYYDNKESAAYRIRGDCYRNLGIKDKAIDDYEKSLKYNPNAGTLLYNIANFYEDYDYVKSIDYYQKHHLKSAQSPGSSSGPNWSILGEAFARAGFKEKAESNAKEALLLYGDSAYYYYSLSQYELITCSFAKSLEYALKSSKSDSTLHNYYILNIIANDYAMLGQLKESLIYEKRYVGKVSGQGQYFIGYMLWENGFRKEAEKYFDDFIKYCNKVISLGRRYSRNYNVYYDLAAVYAFKGDKEKAYECLRTYSKNRTIISSYTSASFKINPLFRSIRNEPEFQQIAREIEAKYLAEHERVRKWLEAQEKL